MEGRLPPALDDHRRGEERNEEEVAIDDWLPITAARNAKWWYSTFHNVTVIVGAGVLSLPYSMSRLGWGPGITLLVMSWIITLYTLWEMVEMHEMIPGMRFDRYHELGQYAFGRKLGLWIVVPLQLVVEVGTNIVYMIVGGKSLKNFHDIIVCPDNYCNRDIDHDDNTCCNNTRLSHFTLIFGTVHFLTSQLPSFNSISLVSFAAAVTSVSYSVVAWGASINHGKTPEVDYGYNSQNSTGETVLNFFNALGTVGFAFAGHNVILEIHASIPSTPEKPSKKPMWKGSFIAYIIVALCYFPVAIFGFWVLGNDIKNNSNILVSICKPKWLIAMGNMLVAVHFIGSYQVYAMPVFDMMESLLLRKYKFRPSFRLRLITRSLYVAMTLFFAIILPFFEGLLGFFGGFAFAPTTYFLPCIIWLKIVNPKRFSLSWFANWTCIILGLSLMIVAPIGGLRIIIREAKNYTFFSCKKRVYH